MRQLTPQQKEQKVRAERVSIAAFSFTVWAVIACLCIAAFWQHIDSMKVAYPVLTKAGAVATEVIILFFVYWHCFNHHIGVRRTALWLGIVLSVASLVHAGALYGMGQAKQAQLETEKRLEERLTRMSEKQMGAASGMRKGATQQELGKNAQKELAETVKGGEDKVIAASIMPEWYLRGGMFATLIALGLVFGGICISKMHNNQDIDSNFDDIPDYLQQPQQPNWRQYAQDPAQQQYRAGNTGGFPAELPIDERATGPLAIPERNEPGKVQRR